MSGKNKTFFEHLSSILNIFYELISIILIFQILQQQNTMGSLYAKPGTRSMDKNLNLDKPKSSLMYNVSSSFTWKKIFKRV